MTKSCSRSLTAGEIDLARSIFGDSIDYSKVRLIKGKWWPFQPRNAAMAPSGDIYFHPVAGGWYDQFDRNGTSLVATIPASSFYHVLSAVAEAEQVLA